MVCAVTTASGSIATTWGLCANPNAAAAGISAEKPGNTFSYTKPTVPPAARTDAAPSAASAALANSTT